MQLPMIHWNGTARKELVEQIGDVLHRLDDTISAVRQATPHMRDYYPQRDPQAWHKAMEEHEDRLRRLQTLRSEYEQLGEALMDLPGQGAPGRNAEVTR